MNIPQVIHHLTTNRESSLQQLLAGGRYHMMLCIIFTIIIKSVTYNEAPASCNVRVQRSKQINNMTIKK